MKTRYWLAAAVLAAVVHTSAVAQQPTSPVAPRAGAAGAALDGKIAVIDSGKMLQSINELRIKQDQVRAKFEPRIKQIEATKTQLEQMQNDIKSKQAVVPPETLQKMIVDFQDRQKVFERSGQDLQDEVNKESEAALGPVQKKLEDFTKSYAASHGISLILNAQGLAQTGVLAYMTDACDITDDFIAEYNKANPVPGGAAAARPASGK